MSVTSTSESMHRGGFPMGGEPLAALDLADTVMTAVQPPRDLIADPERAEAWWKLERCRLPAGGRPEDVSTRRLRAAIRDLFDAYLEEREPLAVSVADVNAFAAAVPTSEQLSVGPGGPESTVRWHTEHGGNVLLAAIAREAIELLADPDQRTKLRRCANPVCSMLFLAQNKRRIWCSSTGCGNRARVARHYHKTRVDTEEPS
jgi:predicted RNA-binding Zn ribbon-like protein